MKSSKIQKILAIDTSCDETAAAVTDGVRVLSNVIASQTEIHRKFGGVEPGLARREHRKLIGPVVKKALESARTPIEEIEAVAVTYGPGLAIALEVGVAEAKKISQENKLPLIGIDHMEGHLLSAFAEDREGNHGIEDPKFPALGLLVSGGHTELILMKEFGKYELIGQTLDDAAGEGFDKVARLLNLEYPGGPALSKLAKEGDGNAYRLPVPMRGSGDLNFSFSGLKTAVLYLTKKEKLESPKEKADLAASFERAAVAHLTGKLREAILKYEPGMIMIGGGVINNRRLQAEIKKVAGHSGIPVHIPFSSDLLTDNAGMIGVAAYFKSQRKEFVKDPRELDRIPNLSL